ncbi:MAG: nucleotide-diphosphate-sugar epimerase [Herpetosiphonaceae bacterium]|nr:MAG: nucleotide-diphosphate-sugar epimerase [Herpetosiphonaceae bacterium]
MNGNTAQMSERNMRVLVTGGTGVLGRQVVSRLAAAGYRVRVMSRRAPRPGEARDLEWARADMESGAGLAEAVAGVNVIVHAASGPFRARRVDVEGTARLLDLARAAGVDHIVYVSIVGIDNHPYPYFRHKLATEAVVRQGGVPWSIVRIVQFHAFIDLLLRGAAKLPLPIVLLPTDFPFQPIDEGEAAQSLIEQVAEGPSGGIRDVAGPQVLTTREIARLWLAARGQRRRILHLPLPGKIAAAYRRGDCIAPQHSYGTITWAEWLERVYSRNPAAVQYTPYLRR